MTRQNTMLVYHSICGKRSAEDAGFSTSISTNIFAGEVWTTFYYPRKLHMIRLNSKRGPLRSGLSRGFFKEFFNSMVGDTKSIGKLHEKEENSREPSDHLKTVYRLPSGLLVGGNYRFSVMRNAGSEVKLAADVRHFPKNEETLALANSPKIRTNFRTQHLRLEGSSPVFLQDNKYPFRSPRDTANADSLKVQKNPLKPTGFPDQKQHKLRIWLNKGARNSRTLVPNLCDTACQKLSQKRLIKKWLGKERLETIISQRINKTRGDVSKLAAEVALIASVRCKARQAAKAGAFAAAAYAYVTAVELGSQASHGSLAAAIGKACKDVARTAVIAKAKNDDYIRLHRLFYYHYKFRGPGYYKPLNPLCTTRIGPEGEPVVHCKMEGGGETLRGFEAPGKDSPLILFLKQFSVGSEVKEKAARRSHLRQGKIDVLFGPLAAKISTLGYINPPSITKVLDVQSYLQEKEPLRLSTLLDCPCDEKSHCQNDPSELMRLGNERKVIYDKSGNPPQTKDLQDNLIEASISGRQTICEFDPNEEAYEQSQIFTSSVPGSSASNNDSAWNNLEDIGKEDSAAKVEADSYLQEPLSPTLQLADFFRSPSQHISLEVRSQAIPLSPTSKLNIKGTIKKPHPTARILEPIIYFLETYGSGTKSNKVAEMNVGTRLKESKNKNAETYEEAELIGELPEAHRKVFPLYSNFCELPNAKTMISVANSFEDSSCSKMRLPQKKCHSQETQGKVDIEQQIRVGYA